MTQNDQQLKKNTGFNCTIEYWPAYTYLSIAKQKKKVDLADPFFLKISFGYQKVDGNIFSRYSGVFITEIYNV